MTLENPSLDKLFISYSQIPVSPISIQHKPWFMYFYGMNIYHLIICLCCFSPGATVAQLPGLTEPDNIPDTLVFPFRSGLQMIMIDHAAARDRQVSFKEAMQPRAVPWDAIIPPAMPNTILFRDSSGRIRKVFNSTMGAGYWESLLSSKLLHLTPNTHSHFFAHRQTASLHRSFYYPARHGSDSITRGFYRVFDSPVQQRNRKMERRVKTGLIDSLGNIVLTIDYDAILSAGRYYLVQRKGFWGLMDPSFSKIIDYRYNNVKSSSSTYLTFYTTDTPRLVFDIQKEQISQLDRFDWIDEEKLDDKPAAQKALPIRVSANGKFGLINRKFMLITPCMYDFMHPVFRDGLLLVNRNNKWGYLNKEGVEAIPCMYEDAIVFDNSVAAVSLNGQIFCINTKGERIEDGRYAGSSPEQYLRWNESFAGPGKTKIVSRIQMKGLTDGDNKLIVPIIYNSILPLEIPSIAKNEKRRTTYLLARRNDKWGIITTSNEEILPFVYDQIGQFTGTGKFIPVIKNQKHGLLDSNLNWLAACRYEGLNPHSVPGKLIFLKNGKWGWMNMREEEELPAIYDHIGWMRDGRVVVSIGKKSGMLNRDGNVLIPVTYDFLADRIVHGLLLAGFEKRVGYLDSTGRIAIPFIYEEGRNFDKPAAAVKQGNKFGFINQTGSSIGTFDYDFVDHHWMPDGLVKVMKENKFGFADESGRLVIPCMYDDVSGYNQQGHRVRKDGQWLYVQKP